MTAPTASHLLRTLDQMATRSASAVVARSRASSPGLNAALLRRLSAPAGTPGSLLAEPTFETARSWMPASETFGSLSGNLLSPDLVEALDRAGDHAMPKERRPYWHQVEAWRTTLGENASCLVTAGTGAGKTECFLIPILDDLLKNVRRGGGVQAVLLYPLNALIDSQRDRLKAWAEGLGGRVRFALFNGNTPETPRRTGERPGGCELKSRREIRERPPEILVTNITMLEYMLLRPTDEAILERSQGALRWIVLDEAHVYAGAQAAEMALLLRRVRAAFGVSSEDVRLIATSATIGGESDVKGKLAEFISALAGRPVDAVRVIEGRVAEPELPAPGLDEPINLDALHELDAQQLWRRFAPHPRLQKLRLALAKGPQLLGDIAETLFRDRSLQADTQAILDAAARADAGSGPLLPWRAHLFHKPLGGVWACIDASCPERDPELRAEGANWKFGALNLGQRDRCSCGAPAFEVFICAECGNAHLVAGQQGGAQPRLEPLSGDGGDDFGLDVEPEAEEEVIEAAGRVWLFPANGGGLDCWVALSGQPVIFDNAPPDDVRAVPLRIFDRAEDRCCGASGRKDAMPLRYGPAFFMGNSLPLVVEALAPPVGGADMPSRGRRALTFSDSRQGVARLAAKLQQDAERALTRAFLYHTVQGREDGDLAKVAQLEDRLNRLRKSPDDFADIIRETEAELARISGTTLKTVPWPDLVNQFAQHAELSQFAGKAWAGRIRGAEMAEDPKRLAQMLLFRELFRRPKVQNNPETMGLLRLAFPDLEAKARLQGPPRPLQEAGVDGEGWRELALLAIDVIFRDYLAVDLPDPALPSLISPRFGVLRGVGAIGTEQSALVRAFPGARPGPRPSNLHRAVYSLIGGHWDSGIDQSRASTVMEALWTLIATTAARDVGRGVWRIDFSGKAHIERIDEAFYCPVARRLQGYAVLGRSPRQLDPDQPLADIPPMERVAMPRLPIANRGGLDEAGSKTVQAWCESNPAVAALRRRGLWTDLHDRVASFAPFLRAQEHSAQIDRAVLTRYVEQFTAGEINFLNCSTTMEMGVDIPQVRLVVNSNVPPSIANYRQRAGRAGRRGEPWAFTLTFARDLPLDRFAADDGARYLRQDVAAPRVWLESASLVQRHVNAFLLGAFLRSRGGLPLKSSTGAFFGAGTEEAVLPGAPAEAFLNELSSPAMDTSVATSLRAIVAGSALEQSPIAALAAATAQTFKTLLERWRAEYGQLLERAAAMADQDARLALTFRARRMHGEFLLGELARRNFTPAYGFPTDVVSFDFLSGRRSESQEGGESFGLFQGAASRTLDVAIREYAPGAELVIDGLVYRSEGILPAWGGDADNSRLEDLRELWSCNACGCFGLARDRPSACHGCGDEGLTSKPTLAPAGFISRAAPHTGYESLAQAPFEMPRISAARGAWCALPEAAGGRFRADAAGEVIVTGGGVHGEGYAVCLACGRAEAEPPRDGGTLPSLARSMKPHRPLMLGRGTVRAADGNCPGGHTQPNRVQRGVTLVHAARTDVFELQLASEVSQEAGLALAAGLRDGLAERLGVEAREIGVAVGSSIGPSGEARLSLQIFDRAAGGAGYALRLADPETIALVSERALDRLACPEDCKVGCAACVLRPDLNIRDLRLDRRGGHDAAAHLVASLNLPAELRTFGPDSRPLGRAALDWLKLRLAQGRLTAIVVFLPAELPGWDIDGWAMPNLLRDMADRGIVATLAIPAPLVASTRLTLVDRLAILRAASGGQLVTVTAPPHMGGRAIAAIVGERTFAVAIACEAAEALPGPDWCASASGPVVVGPAPNTPTLSSLSVEALLGPLSKAAIVWPGRRLDGDLQKYGQRFWTLLQNEAPALMDIVNSSGVRSLSYSDRYLVTPLSIALAAQVIRQVPNAGTAKILLSLAPADPSRREPDAIHDSFERNADRRGLVEALIPGASIFFARRKSELHHHRELRLMLGSGKTVSILLDQGFGSWRSDYTRHNFQAPASAQSRAMTALRLQVRAETDQGSPIAVSLSETETNEAAR